MARGFGKQKSKLVKSSKAPNKGVRLTQKNSLWQSACTAYQSREFALAKENCQKLLKMDSNFEHAWFLWGNIERDLENLPQAIAVYAKLTQIQPQNINALSNLGVLYVQQKQVSKAISCFTRAIEINPSYAQAYSNLGQLHKDCGEIDLAQHYLEQAIGLNPQDANAHYNLGNVYKHQHCLSEAIATYQTAIELNPRYSNVYNNLGNTYLEMGELNLAYASYQKALILKSTDKNIDSGNLEPNQSKIYFPPRNLSNAPIPNQSSAPKSDFKPLASIGAHNLLFALNYDTNLTPQNIYLNHRNWGSQYDALSPTEGQLHGSLDPERPLKIGYVSGDFKTHSVSYFLQPLLAYRDRANFEITCYANNRHQDQVTEKLKGLVDHWQDIAELDDIAVVEMIRQDQIDILVDLSGHTLGNRLSIFAVKPAPIQVTYLGYPNTTGLSAMDYRLTDAKADPVGMTETWHSEELVRLKQSFLCYQPPENTPELNSLPAIAKGYVMFGSFNSLTKVSPEIIDCWADILRQVPQSRLLIKAKSLQDAGVRERIYHLFAEAGIAGERLELRGWIPEVHNHLALYQEIDIALDTYPYHGTTTTCEALWMGIPVITLAGETHVSRVGVSILSAVSLIDLIANSPEEYVSNAVTLAKDCARLQDLRRSLRETMQQSSLMDGPQITQDFEAAYRQMWHKYCAQNTSSTQVCKEHNFAKELVEENLPPKLLEPKPNLAMAIQQALQYLEQKKPLPAKKILQQIIEQQPNLIDAWHLLGGACYQQQQFTEAIAHYQRALQIEPDNVLVLGNLGVIYIAYGDLATALGYWQRVLQLQPGRDGIWQNILFCLHYSSKYSPEYIFQQHVVWGQRHHRLAPSADFTDPHELDPQRTLKIGYVSGDLKHHPVAYFLLPLLKNCDRYKFEIFCYANNTKQDNLSEQIKQLTHWRDIAHLDDSQVVKQIKQDQIDILVDLSGHNGDNRLLIFAQKPAPLQATYLGYADTTGLGTVDYRLTDQYCDPPGTTEHLHTEELIHLAHSWLCYQPHDTAPEVSLSPYQKNGFITFGSFNNLAKISETVIDYWAKILHQVPDSKLLLKYRALDNPEVRDRFYRLFEQAGIDSDRLILQGWLKGNYAHLAAYHEIDIALDTYPYHGTTTTCEALYMGVPVITLAGKIHLSRAGVSLLSSVGLTEFVTDSAAAYVSKAIELANNRDQLSHLRANLRSQMQASPLMDGRQITQDIEAAYRQMWLRYCQQKLEPTIAAPR